MCMDAIASNQQIVKKVSQANQIPGSLPPGGSQDIYCDIFQVPVGFYAVVKQLSIRWISTPASPCPTIFACDPSYGFGTNPLLPGPAEFDTTKAGVALTGSNETNPSTANVMTTLLGVGEDGVSSTNDIVLGPGWFLRAATQTGNSGGVSANAQFEIQCLFALLPLPC